MKSIAFFLLLMVSAIAEEPHIHGDNVPDWYDPSCCNQRDCRPVKDDEIEFGEIGGQPIIRHKPTGAVFQRSQFRQSQDERYHVCINVVSGAPLCVYLRAGA